MAQRERINRVKIERWRVSRVPINPAETIYQGDMLQWHEAAHRAEPLTAVASGGNFLGISETTNPTETAGSPTFLSNIESPRVNVITDGLVELVAGETMHVYPFDFLTVGANAQTVVKTGATTNNAVGRVDPAYGAAGQAIAAGSLVRFWLRPLVRIGP